MQISHSDISSCVFQALKFDNTPTFSVCLRLLSDSIDPGSGFFFIVSVGEVLLHVDSPCDSSYGSALNYPVVGVRYKPNKKALVGLD